MIIYNTDNVKMPVFPKRKISNWIKQTAETYEKRVGEVSYIFCSEEKILQINKDYLSHDYITDVITFDYSENKTISGDIFICVEKVRTNATEYKSTFIEELYRVMIHGILHLCGLSDKTAKERANMRKKEFEALTCIIHTIK